MSSLPTISSEAWTRPAGEMALPRADVALPQRLRRRDAWGRGRRWPFGPVATTVSIALHAVALVGIVWALATPPEPDAIGAQVYAVLTPDLGDPEPRPLLDVPGAHRTWFERTSSTGFPRGSNLGKYRCTARREARLSNPPARPSLRYAPVERGHYGAGGHRGRRSRFCRR